MITCLLDHSWTVFAAAPLESASFPEIQQPSNSTDQPHMSMDMDDNVAQATVAEKRQDPTKDGKQSQSKQM